MKRLEMPFSSNQRGPNLALEGRYRYVPKSDTYYPGQWHVGECGLGGHIPLRDIQRQLHHSRVIVSATGGIVVEQ
jgi:hypothetical protein